MAFYLGIDIGTSSLRAGLYDGDGHCCGLACREYGLIAKEPGQAELDPAVIWGSLVGALGELCPGKPVKALGLSAFMHSLLLVDEAWNPLTGILTWADTRASQAGDALGALPNIGQLYQATGCRISHPMSPSAKLLWLRRSQPALFERAAYFVTAKQWLVHKLTGENILDVSDAASMGLLNQHSSQWEPALMAQLGLDTRRLGQIAPCTQLLSLKPDRAGLLSLPQDVVLCLGSTDGILANVGCGALDDSALTSTIGTSGALRVLRQEPFADAQLRLWSYCFTPGLWAVGGAINNGGLVLKWLRDQFLTPFGAGAGAYERFDGWAAGVPVGCQGLVFSPSLTGERSPDWNSAATGALVGLTMAHGPGHIVRAAMEGVLFRLYWLHQLLQAQGLGKGRLVASGGYTRSKQWLQMQADLFGCPVEVPREKEATLLGAAYLAMVATGQWQMGKPLPAMKAQAIYQPQPGQGQAWQQAYGRYLEVYHKLSGQGER